MSGEFGSYERGYFYYQIETGANDCLNGRAEITRKWGKLLKDFSSIARAISWCEASDSGEYEPILESIKNLTSLKNDLTEIERYLKPYEECIKEAIKNDK